MSTVEEQKVQQLGLAIQYLNYARYQLLLACGDSAKVVPLLDTTDQLKADVDALRVKILCQQAV
jgi:hypothetical protein